MYIKKKIFLALSGGVDSAVSAKLLKDQGHQVVGVFMKNWSGDEYGIQSNCPWEEDQKDAEAVCKSIGIDFMSVNFEKEYREKVVKYFFDGYQKGHTPNPDIMCNKEIKFKLFFEKSQSMGFDAIATGHYARNIFNIDLDEFELKKGVDDNKDQTYFIYNLSQEVLERSYFPIGDLTKSEVRALAQKFNLPNANKPDSQGICFIGEINVLKYLQSKLPKKKGEIIDIDTRKVVGEHNGIYFYTIGQREGLGIGGQKVPYYVVDKDIEKNILYVGHGEDHPAMSKSLVHIENLHLINTFARNILEKENKITLQASIRYRQKPQNGQLILENGVIKFLFDMPQKAIAVGQSLVLYKEDTCLGGGIIQSSC